MFAKQAENRVIEDSVTVSSGGVMPDFIGPS